jgi:riboflavin kinase / FMN adenylyltransferase
MKLPLKIRSKIVHGNKMGRKLGFPTANFDINNLEIWQKESSDFLKFKFDSSKQFLEPGIYAGKVFLQEQVLKGAIYIGPNETFEQNKFKLEVHILDFDKDIYDQILEVEILEKVRSDKKFESIPQIQKQIQTDCQKIRDLLKNS